VHLALPLPVAVVVAAIIETLGLATVHTALWAYEWNVHKRKSDPGAPVTLTVALGAVYMVATLGLVVFLEVWPVLATYAPAIFPALAVVGALNLAIISRQEHREAAIEAEKEERRLSRSRSKAVQANVQNDVLDAVNRTRRARKAALLDTMVDLYKNSPEAGPTEVAKQIGVGRSTVYTYLEDLESAGRVSRDNGRVKVLEGR
jgi:hypothetical protein